MRDIARIWISFKFLWNIRYLFSDCVLSYVFLPVDDYFNIKKTSFILVNQQKFDKFILFINFLIKIIIKFNKY